MNDVFSSLVYSTVLFFFYSPLIDKIQYNFINSED